PPVRDLGRLAEEVAGEQVDGRWRQGLQFGGQGAFGSVVVVVDEVDVDGATVVGAAVVGGAELGGVGAGGERRSTTLCNVISDRRLARRSDEPNRFVNSNSSEP